MKLVSLQGRVYLAPRDANGNPTVFRDVGNVSSLELQPQTQTVEHYESQSGQRLQDGRLIIRKTMTLRAVFEEWSMENLALSLYSTSTNIASGSVTGETFPNGISNGDIVRLQYTDVSSLVIKDSAGTPATLTLNTDYEIVSAKHGTVKFLNTAGFTQPFKADYSYGGGTRIAMFDTAPQEVWLKVDGINTAEADKPILAELYRVIFDPPGAMQMIHNEGYGPLELTGSALYDATKQANTDLGQFGRIVEIA